MIRTLMFFVMVAVLCGLLGYLYRASMEFEKQCHAKGGVAVRGFCLKREMIVP